ARGTIAAGLQELQSISDELPIDCALAGPAATRHSGGGRKPLTHKDPTLLADLLALVEPSARGDPQSPLRWSCKSLRQLAQQLRQCGHVVSHVVVGQLLKAEGFSLQGHAKVIEGNQSPDRNAQFEYINATVGAALACGQPVISVDTKKKELVGQFKNGGKQWRPKGQPEQVKVHDFVDPELGRASPYGVYDIAADQGWVSVGTDHDTAAFAVQTIRRWWYAMGKTRYPHARELTITADGGGSNGHRVRLWKLELNRFAQESGLNIRVCHFPPGTSKWNKIEHRMFSFITMNWRGQPLVTHEIIVNLIAGTKTKSGLNVRAELDTNSYPKGVVVSEAEMAAVRMERDTFHGDWTYRIFSE
ncbi:MAG: ISAzo13 family transposase, partial [Burkholderiaceae bacterium]|nr:ISAzo13 family transposase [Burkholderiaceae bacterium]